MIHRIIYFCSFIVFVFGDCGIISKDEWGGLKPTHVKYLPRPVSLVIIQHTATGTCETDAGCENIVRSIQNTHMDELGFWDIGPSFLVGSNGKIYEGSGWRRVGAHTYGYNSKSIGITFIGNFNYGDATKEAMDATRALLECGVKKNHLARDYQLVGHRQLIATESPGRFLYRKIRNWPNYESDKDNIE